MPRKKAKDPAKDILKNLVPVSELFTEEEREMYKSLVDIYMEDFEGAELTSMDVDDIMALAMNKVLELRLLSYSKGDPARQMDVTSSIEKLKKQSEKIKENLSIRRKDRLSKNDTSGITIVDLAVAFDNKRKAEMERKARKLKELNKSVREELASHGNRYDKT